MLMAEFLGFSISTIVPEGPSWGTSAMPSTIPISPPPRAEVGEMFMAGFRSGMGLRIFAGQVFPTALPAAFYSNENTTKKTGPWGDGQENTQCNENIYAKNRCRQGMQSIFHPPQAPYAGAEILKVVCYKP